MKRNWIIILIATIFLGLGYFIGLLKSSVHAKFEVVDREIARLDTLNDLAETRSLNQDKEDFDDFLSKFMRDSLFQLERVKFPLKSQQWNTGEVDSVRIERSNWKMVRFFLGEEYRPQIYDNFKGEMRDTDERLFCWEGIDNGINVEYRFYRFDGKWYLIEFRDFSD